MRQPRTMIESLIKDGIIVATDGNKDQPNIEEISMDATPREYCDSLDYVGFIMHLESKLDIGIEDSDADKLSYKPLTSMVEYLLTRTGE